MAGKVSAPTNGKRIGHSDSVQSESRELTPIQVANEVVTRIRLKRVRFRDIAARAAVAAEAIPDDTRLRASTNFCRPTIDVKDAGFKAVSTMIFKLSTPASPVSERGNEVEPCVVVKAVLEATYSFKDESPEFTEEQLKTFALHYCPFHVWGYWREFVHSSLARLEYPALTVPLFQIDMVQALVVEELD